MKEPAEPGVIVYVNGERRRLFLGLRVRHAIGYRKARQVERGQAVVKDDEGNVVDLDGALHEGERLIVRGPRSGYGSGPMSR